MKARKGSVFSPHWAGLMFSLGEGGRRAVKVAFGFGNTLLPGEGKPTACPMAEKKIRPATAPGKGFVESEQKRG